MNFKKLLDEQYYQQRPFLTLTKELKRAKTIYLRGLSGSSVATVAAGAMDGVSIIVADDRDSAAYIYSDLAEIVAPADLLFFPTAYKRSIQYGVEDPSGIVQRTAVLNALQNFDRGRLVICTYPEAIAEKVVGRNNLRENTLSLKVGENVSISFIEEVLIAYNFQRVDFVYEPGQYSVRGGIVDIFSFSDNKPYRVDFFGDMVDSIRTFGVGTQLSVEKREAVEIVPNLKTDALADSRIPFTEFVDEATYWLCTPDSSLMRLDQIRKKLLSELDDPTEIDNHVTSRSQFLAGIAQSRVVMLSGSVAERPADATVEFETSPQPAFNKNFEMLADDIDRRVADGYSVYIMTVNKLQIERLENIFHSVGKKQTRFGSINTTLHEGFIDHTLRVCFYTDHQIFDRFHRYKIAGELDKEDSLTVQELNSLQVGDYVVHIDHGVGRFGGLIRTMEDGKPHEAIKLVYRDGDVLLVNVHALHRISKYKDKDSEPPKIYKLGTGAWQKLKQSTKKHVKDIAGELIALYAKRRAAEGHAFAPDSYMQHELEASFMYEDTPDQYKACVAVKEDMESGVPMDRLVCGDVGFGKTEVAVRAAFKAVADGKQVAVLVPTTVLSLQHFRTFSSRLRDFPVRVENFSRAKSAKQVTEILKDLKDGKVDIIVGTHKLLGKSVEFKDLGLLVVDEEQKFGVSMKERLRQLRANVDTLTLTATPIPRTLQFSLMGARDLSIINTPPLNRQPIATEVHRWNDDIIREAIDYELDRGGQVFFVHNRVQNIDQIQSMIRRLCPRARTVVGHGQMAPAELERVMMDFIYGEYDVLIATTIIESGIDISNANTMIINNAQNFGLSDLHQLRGRVGRTNRKAFCYLITPPEESLTSEANRRLRAIEEFSELGSGFNIAMQDLDIRGAGNMLGAEQSGFIADIGFETYQKILNEAIAELREDTGEEPATGTSYVTDTIIDTDLQAHIPDSYVSNTAEKIRLYRSLDSLADEQGLAEFADKLRDRFGEIPREVEELFNVVRLRWLSVQLGFERIVIKNRTMLLYFVANGQSGYYKTSVFTTILGFVSQNQSRFKVNQGNNKLSLSVKDVKNMAAAIEILTQMMGRN